MCLKSNTATIRVSKFERCGYMWLQELAPKRHWFKRYLTTCSTHANHSRLSRQHDWGNLCDLTSTKIFTFIMNKISHDLQKLRRMWLWIWFRIGSHVTLTCFTFDEKRLQRGNICLNIWAWVRLHHQWQKCSSSLICFSYPCCLVIGTWHLKLSIDFVWAGHALCGKVWRYLNAKMMQLDPHWLSSSSKLITEIRQM